MQLSQSTQMRTEMRQLLTPRMIQSMEILQLPLMALEERIEQEMQNNPVLEMREGDAEVSVEATAESDQAREEFSEGEQALTMKEDASEDFDRLERISDYFENEEFSTNGSSSFRQSSYDGERDKKLDAMNNTAARGVTLIDFLLGQWRLWNARPAFGPREKRSINAIDAEGYFRIEMEQLKAESKNPLQLEDLQAALKLVQTLEPAGVGARNLRECLLIQLEAIEEDPDASEGHDFDLERALIVVHLKDLEMNRYPQISKKMGRSIEELKQAVKKLGCLHPHPGKLIGDVDAPPITPDANIYYDEDTDKYEIEMTHEPAENLYISGMWRKFLKEKKGDRKTREFLSNNVRNARWLIESIEQRKSTIMRVIRAVVDAQREFFDKGPEFLRPLPMILVADQLGITWPLYPEPSAKNGFKLLAVFFRYDDFSPAEPRALKAKT